MASGLVLLACPSPEEPATPEDPAAPALEDLPPLIDREVLFGDPELAGAQVSPDGDHISFRQEYEGKMNVWVKEAGQDFEDAWPVTADTERSITSYFWSRDSERILFAQDDGGDENFRVYAVDPTGEPEDETGVPEARDLTPLDDVQARIIAVPDGTPEEILVGLNDRDPEVHDVYRVDLDTGERELLIENTENVASWHADLEGEVRAATRQNEEGDTDLHWVEEGELSDEPFYSCTVLEECSAAGFHEDNERLYLTTNRGEDRDLSELVLFDPDTGEAESVESDPEERVDFGGTVFNEDDELIATYYIYDEGVEYYPRDGQFERDLEFLEAELPAGDIHFGASTKDERLQIVSFSRDVDPGSAYLYNREEEEVEKLYDARPELASEELAPMEPISYEARDGLEIPAYLTLPRDVEPENLPMVVVPHGGPWARDTWGYSATAQFFANRGYAVLQPNFRGSTGYGKEFLNAGNQEWGDAMQDDITDGVEHLVEEGIADPDRVGIYGGSYGGYATLAGLAFTPELYAAGVSFVGPSNILTLIETIPPYWAPMIEMFYERVGDPDDPEDRERLERQSPLFSADQIEAPLMVVQGANDPRVVQRESDQIVAAARDNDLDVEYLVAEDEGHGFVNEDNRLAYIAAMESFFAEHLNGRSQEEMAAATEEALGAMKTDPAEVELEEDVAEVEPAELPEVEAGSLEPATFAYDLNLEVQGQELEVSLTRAIEEAEEERGALKVSETQEQEGGPSNEQTFWLDGESLRTLAQEGAGQMESELTFAEDAIGGSISAMGQEVEVDESLEAPVFGAGGADTEVASAALPLGEGYETRYRTYDVQQQSTRQSQFEVEGTETVEVPAGSFETYRVRIEAVGDEGAQTTYVLREAPHHVVKAEAELPPAMGGGEAHMELVEME